MVPVVDLLNFSEVVVPLITEVHVSCVVSKHARNLFIVFENSSFEILLRFVIDISDFVVAVKIVSIISEFNFAMAVVVESAHSQIVERVFGVITSNCLTVVESNFLVTQLIDLDVCDREGHLALAISRVSIGAVRAFDKIMGDWRVMRCLLHEQVSSVSTFGLVGFSKNWIERLLEKLTFMDQSNGASHEDFEPFQWVRAMGGVIQVPRVDVLDTWATLHY